MGADIDFLLDCLAEDDDPDFWQFACSKIFEKPLKVIPNKEEDWPVYMMVGPCSRWLSSEPTRFSDTQGAPLPSNSRKEKYSRLVMPEYDWSVLYYFDPEKQDWTSGREPMTNHYLFRVALPAKSSNLKHAVVLTHWEPLHPINPDSSDFPQLYNFRKLDDEWKMISREV